MNLVISQSKNSKSLYIKKSFRKNGKTTSKTVKKTWDNVSIIAFA